jgi:hypothetical protein
MKKIGIIIFAVALLAGVIIANLCSFGRLGARLFNVSFNVGSVSGSGNIVKDKRDVSGFKSVDVGGVFKVEVTAQKDFEVEVMADDNLLQYIKTEVDGGVLKIETEKRIISHEPILVRVSAPDIENIEASGASNVSLTNLKNTRLGVDTSGASKVSIEGETAKLTIDVSGASKIDAENLKADSANVDASGASSVNVNVSNELTADATGASKIIYSGNVKNVTKKTSGASSISQK